MLSGLCHSATKLRPPFRAGFKYVKAPGKNFCGGPLHCFESFKNPLINQISRVYAMYLVYPKYIMRIRAHYKRTLLNHDTVANCEISTIIGTNAKNMLKKKT